MRLARPRPRLAGNENPALTGVDRGAMGGKGNAIPTKLASGMQGAGAKAVQSNRDMRMRARAAKQMTRPTGRSDGEVQQPI